jgi:hypothetical protein
MSTSGLHALAALTLAATAAYAGESSTYPIFSGGDVVGAISLPR